MPSQLNRVPAGFLNFLDLKSQGQAPDIVPDQMAPTMDMFGFYSLGKRTNVVATLQNLPAGTLSQEYFNDVLGCPSTEVWYVFEFSVRMQLVAGEKGQIAPFVSRATRGGASAICQIGDFASVPDPVSAGLRLWSYARHGLWLEPGDILGFSFSGVLTGIEAVTGEAHVLKLTI